MPTGHAATDAETLLRRLHPDAARRRRRLAAAAWVLVAAIGVVTSWWIVRGDGRGHYGGVSWAMPPGWSSHDAGGSGCHVQPGGLAPGPFVGTVRTGSVVRRTTYGWSCSRALGVPSDLPADAVVAWLSVGPLLPSAPAADPGPVVQGVCGPGSPRPDGTVFHAYRQLGDTGDGMRVALDGCVFGPRAATHLAQLSAVARSLAYSPSH